MITNKQITEMSTHMSFERAVSLGHFCAPSMQLESIGLRDGAYPFDWLIFSDFEYMIELISKENCCNLFGDISGFSQDVNNRNYYRQDEHNIRFLHDFNSFQSLEAQWKDFMDKYQRRYNRLMSVMEFPTLFVRYIAGGKESEYISQNCDYIESVLKKKCQQCEILFVANRNVNVDLDVVRVESDGKMSFTFIDDNPDLKNWLLKTVKSPNTHKSKSTGKRYMHLLNKVLPKYKHYKTYVETD